MKLGKVMAAIVSFWVGLAGMRMAHCIERLLVLVSLVLS